jgi:hypothetical protein
MTLKEGRPGQKVIDHSGTLDSSKGNFNLFERSDAWARRQQRIRFLRLGERQHQRLADKLSRCVKSHRCKSEPVCVTLFHEKLCRAVGVGLPARPRTIARVVTSKLLVPYGHLSEFDLTEAVGRLRERIARSSLCDRIAIGAIDLSLVIDEETIIGWQMHLNLLIEGKNDARLQKAIKDVLPAEPRALKPYRFKDVVDSGQVLPHFYRAKFYRKAYFRTTKRRSVAKLPLTSEDLKELLSFLGRYPGYAVSSQWRRPER